MFCSQCGKQISDQAKFCRYCGTELEVLEPEDKETEAKVGSKTDGNSEKPVNGDTRARQETEAQRERLQQLIGNNMDYYMAQFITIEKGGKGSFNWAAFFGGPLHAAYRRMGKVVVVYFVLPLILQLFAVFMMSDWKTMGLGMFLTAAGGVWYFISYIVIGVRFNSLYYRELSEAAANPEQSERKAGTSGGNVTGVIFLYICACIIFSTVSVGAMLGSLFDDNSGLRLYGDDNDYNNPEVGLYLDIPDNFVDVTDYETVESGYVVWDDSENMMTIRIEPRETIGMSVKELHEMRLRSAPNISYEVCNSKFSVVSGMNDTGDIYYVKSVVTDDLEGVSIYFFYPPSSSDYGRTIVEELAPKFHL